MTDPRILFSALVVSRGGTSPSGEIIRKETRLLTKEALKVRLNAPLEDDTRSGAGKSGF